MLLLATLLSAAGILVYALDRGDAAYFLYGWTAAPAKASIFGPLGDHLPTFPHTLVFILITAAVLRSWFESVPVLQIIADHFIRGTYDSLEIVSIVLGAVIAYPLVRIYLQGDQS